AATQTVTVSGNGPYNASFTLPGDGSTVTGTYLWHAVYTPAPDGNNLTAQDNGVNETAVVSPAQPTLVTKAGGNLQLVNGAATLTDTATPSGAYIDGHVGGSITFTLDYNGAAAPGFTPVVRTVTQNGDYSAS